MELQYGGIFRKSKFSTQLGQRGVSNQFTTDIDNKAVIVNPCHQNENSS